MIAPSDIQLEIPWFAPGEIEDYVIAFTCHCGKDLEIIADEDGATVCLVCGKRWEVSVTLREAVTA